MVWIEGDRSDHEKERTGREKGHTPDQGDQDRLAEDSLCQSRCSGPPSESRKTSDANKTGVIEKSRDGQDFLCTGRHHVIQGHGGPLPALH